MNRSAGRRRPRSAVASANVGIDLKIKIIFDHDWLLFCCFDHRTRPQLYSGEGARFQP